MSIRDLIQETWSALSANKGRSALTILGIVIGISAVISMTSLVGGIQNTLSSSLGLTRSLLVFVNIIDPNAALSAEDIDQLTKDIPEYKGFFPVDNSSSLITTKKGKKNVFINGASSAYMEAQGQQIRSGRSFSDFEERSAQSVCLIAEGSVARLFTLDTYGNVVSLVGASFSDEKEEAVAYGGSNEDNADPSKLTDEEKEKLYTAVIGKTITLEGQDYAIIGVYKNPQDQTVFGTGTINLSIPYSTLRERITGTSEYTQFIGAVHDIKQVSSAEKKTKQWFTRMKGLSSEGSEQKTPSVDVSSMESLAAGFNGFMTGFQMLVGAIAGISLLVGGIGIMNMMLTNVTERIREIGLRKALGAKQSDISKQFLLEACALCVTGGIIGMLFGFLGAWGLSSIVSAYMKMSVLPAITFTSVGLAVGISVATGIIFGFYPARRAARLDPVESLHYQ